MRDKIELHVDDMKISNFTRYTLEADLYTADDAFSFEVPNLKTPIKTGSLCKVYVNDKCELTGLIDRVHATVSKQESKVTIEGRDLMGLLVDSCCTEFFTAEGMKLKTLAERLLKKVPFINRKNIVYQQNIRGKLKGKGKGKGKGGGGSGGAKLFDTGMAFKQIQPGQTIFDVLKHYCLSRGLLFYSLPDGTFVFGLPKNGGEPIFDLTRRKDGKGNNILSGGLDENIAKRFKTVTVVGQQQGTNFLSTASSVNTKAMVTDNTFPFYKPFVATDNNDERSPKLHAQMLMEQQRFDGYKYEYRTPGHSQDDKNWTINEMCSIEDEAIGKDEAMLIYGRTFSLSKEEGSVTLLKLGLPGVVR